MSSLYIITGHPKSGKTFNFIKARAEILRNKPDMVFIQSPFNSMCLFQEDGETYNRLLEMIFWYRDQLILHDGEKIFIDDHPKLMLDTINELRDNGYITPEQELNLDLLINDDMVFDLWGAKIFNLPDTIRRMAYGAYTTKCIDMIWEIEKKRKAGFGIPNVTIVNLKKKKVFKV